MRQIFLLLCLLAVGAESHEEDQTERIIKDKKAEIVQNKSRPAENYRMPPQSKVAGENYSMPPQSKVAGENYRMPPQSKVAGENYRMPPQSKVAGSTLKEWLQLKEAAQVISSQDRFPGDVYGAMLSIGREFQAEFGEPYCLWVTIDQVLSRASKIASDLHSCEADSMSSKRRLSDLQKAMILEVQRNETQIPWDLLKKATKVIMSKGIEPTETLAAMEERLYFLSRYGNQRYFKALQKEFQDIKSGIDSKKLLSISSEAGSIGPIFSKSENLAINFAPPKDQQQTSKAKIVEALYDGDVLLQRRSGDRLADNVVDKAADLMVALKNFIFTDEEWSKLLDGRSKGPVGNEFMDLSKIKLKSLVFLIPIIEKLAATAPSLGASSKVK